MIPMIQKWLKIRPGLAEFLKPPQAEYRVPRRLILVLRTLPTVAFVAFVIQVVTGIVLLIYYIPQEHYAFKSVQLIMDQVPFGWLIRLMHQVGSNLLVSVVVLHMSSTFFLGSYKKPKEFTWVVGAFLLLATMASCLSGYLLPWSQMSYWATTILTDVPTAFPVVGKYITQGLRGVSGPVSDVTLRRFFALHVGLLPLLIILLLGLHDGIPADFRFHRRRQGESISRFVFSREAIAVAVYFITMFGIIAFAPGFFLPPGSNVPADPLKTPLLIRPEWYFRAPYEFLKLIPSKFFGIVVPLILVAIFIFWPYLDKSPQRNILKRPLMLAVFLATVAGWIWLTMRGTF
jgi:ubiquinol-cytochrome c reductase cytochrome b subunit